MSSCHYGLSLGKDPDGPISQLTGGLFIIPEGFRNHSDSEEEQNN
jgi:hypothetical protein